ncbi:hypothetical protein A2U01_0045712 [Trifolium medium]|uniref:Uncharacterized protein n=1 Tax=Trifolium medium TaxID=97028 RepID=A0A392QK06_9FABA|nr:hypothetical protein [Trifolium medium]
MVVFGGIPASGNAPVAELRSIGRGSDNESERESKSIEVSVEVREGYCVEYSLY